MRRLLVGVFAAGLFMSGSLSAKEVYLGIAGSVGVFRTDTRILNPSGEKDITVTATFIPVQGNTAGEATVPVQIPKRQMRVLDDVVSSLFQKSGLGAIKLSSPDDFVATSRIYAASANGTLGQFVQGVDVTEALTKGVIIQLKSNGTGVGTFRTNIGFVNVGAANADIILRLHDRANAVVSTQNITLPAGAALSPVNYFANLTGDFSDAWASFESTQPLVAYGSAIDNGTTDPTFIAAVADSGTEVAAGPRLIDMTARTFAYTPSTITAKKGETITLRIRAQDVDHGFSMPPFVPNLVLAPGVTQEVTFTVNQAGTFDYVCTVVCGTGHTSMRGRMTVTE
jgi:cytochrome c oxidase subunit 2